MTSFLTSTHSPLLPGHVAAGPSTCAANGSPPPGNPTMTSFLSPAPESCWRKLNLKAKFEGGSSHLRFKL